MRLLTVCRGWRCIEHVGAARTLSDQDGGRLKSPARYQRAKTVVTISASDCLLSEQKPPGRMAPLGQQRLDVADTVRTAARGRTEPSDIAMANDGPWPRSGRSVPMTGRSQ
jgi:hypothetical protein